LTHSFHKKSSLILQFSVDNANSMGKTKMLN
jgi:hypothetical protein